MSMRMRGAHVALALTTVLLSLAACSGGVPGEPARGSDPCVNGACIDAGADNEVGIEAGPGATDTGARDALIESGAGDVGSDAADTSAPRPTLRDYIPCTRDADCPNGFGECITSLPLSQKLPDGRSSIPLRELGAASDGVCSRVCTNDATRCTAPNLDGLRDGRGEVAPYVCHVVFAGPSPYPTPPPPFPFASSLDTLALSSGVPFGALCRPPFELHPQVTDAYCRSCDSSGACGAGALCWDIQNGALGTAANRGECLQACSQSEPCPVGFSCAALSSGGVAQGSFCRPVANTCGACADLDHDGFGVGQCGPQSQVTAIDCDDTNPQTYYDPNAPLHPFPALCGAFDHNCNGLSDDVEQVGPGTPFAAQHCRSCNDPCTGATTNGHFECRNVGASPSCVAICDAGFGDCDGIASNGCEAASTAFYPDSDGDGRGDALAAPVYACGGAPPVGHVSNLADCNDQNASVYGALGASPGATETCNGADDDCNGTIDDNPVGTGGSCSTGLLGRCAAGTTQCMGGALQCVQNDQATNEVCNGIDDDCNGSVDEANAATNNIDKLCAAADIPPGTYGVCATGATYKCTLVGGVHAERCVAGSPGASETFGDGIDSDCDNFDGTLSLSKFVAPGGADTGACTRTNKCLTWHYAVSTATAGTTVYIADSATYTTSTTLTLKNGVHLQGANNTFTAKAAGGSRPTLFVLRAAAVNVGVAGVNPGDKALMAARGSNFSAATTLSDLVFETEDLLDAAAYADTSNYGLHCADCTGLALANVDLRAGDAGPGSTGATGAVGVTGLSGIGKATQDPTFNPFVAPIANPLLPSCGAGSFTPGAGGAGGLGTYNNPNRFAQAGAAGGAAQAQSNNVAPAGGSGGDGGFGAFDTPGSPGSPGQPPTEAAPGGVASAVDFAAHGDFLAMIRGGVGGVGRSGGGGGGAGGSNNRSPISAILLETGAHGGHGGSGGCGGWGGQGGHGGGHAIALMLVRTNGATLNGGTFFAGNGGKGGTGGAGGTGGGGGNTSWLSSLGPDSEAGGAGAPGGGGGGGAGGQAGTSLGIVTINSTYSSTVPVSFSLGLAGSASGSGGGGGATGAAGSRVGLSFTSSSSTAPTGTTGASARAGATPRNTLSLP